MTAAVTCQPWRGLAVSLIRRSNVRDIGMTMQRTRLSVMARYPLPLTLLTVLLATSCAKKAGSYDYLRRERTAPLSASEPLPRGASRLLIRTASIQVTVQAVPQAADAAVRITEEAGGYVHESEIDKSGEARLKLRVPADRLDGVLDQLAKLGMEKRRHVSVEDVTDQVTDLDAELANKRALRDRLRALLSRAKDVKDVLSVESELTRVQTDIDSLEGRLKKMHQDIAFSAIDLQLNPPEPEKQRRILGPLGYLYVGTKWFITKLFVIRPGED
jgi:hypothetical protein